MDRSTSCPSCRRPVFPEDPYCSWCGTSIRPREPHTLFARRAIAQQTVPTADRRGCPSCNAPVFPGDLFCSTCGVRCADEPSGGTAAEMWSTILRKLEDGTRGEFEFIRELGRGGMGTVYLARELDLDRLVAIKVLSPTWLADKPMVDRFRREPLAIASVRHPSIVSVYAVGQVDDLYYFTMDFIEGVSLSKVLRAHGPLAFPVAEAILYQVGSALSHAHARGLLHRDVKPGNVMLDLEGNAIVTDFGISKKLDTSSGLTLTEMLMGTPEYMSPEQCRAEDATIKSDQYSLGAVSYAMLTGTPPFSGPHLRVLNAHNTEDPPDLMLARPDCPPVLAHAVLRMLAKRPDDRWPAIPDALSAMGLRPLAHDDPVGRNIAGLVEDARSIRASEPTAVAPSATPTPSKTPPTWMRLLGIPETIVTGDVVDLRASLVSRDGTEHPSDGVLWESTDPDIASIESDSGRMVAHRPGATVITATAAGVTESVAIAVVSPKVTTVTIHPSFMELAVGSAVELLADVRDQAGHIMDEAVEWSSADPALVSVSPNGLVHAVAPGETDVRAAAAEVFGVATIQVFRKAATEPAAEKVLVDPPVDGPEHEETAHEKTAPEPGEVAADTEAPTVAEAKVAPEPEGPISEAPEPEAPAAEADEGVEEVLADVAPEEPPAAETVGPEPEETAEPEPEEPPAGEPATAEPAGAPEEPSAASESEAGNSTSGSVVNGGSRLRWVWAILPVALVGILVTWVATRTSGPPSPTALVLLLDDSLEVGREMSLVVFGETEDGVQIPVQASWSSTDAALDVRPNGTAVGVAPGLATIVAEASGLMAEAPVTVFERPPLPTTGSLTVSVTVTGQDQDRQFTVRVGDRSRPISVGQELSFDSLPAGEYPTSLGGVANNCAPAGPATSTIVAGVASGVRFQVTCVAIPRPPVQPGSLTIRLAGWTGTIIVDGEPRGGESVQVQVSLAPGQHRVQIANRSGEIVVDTTVTVQPGTNPPLILEPPGVS